MHIYSAGIHVVCPVMQPRTWYAYRIQFCYARTVQNSVRGMPDAHTGRSVRICNIFRHSRKMTVTQKEMFTKRVQLAFRGTGWR